jgi:hypothetical protein
VTLAGSNMWLDATPAGGSSDGMSIADAGAVVILTGTLYLTGGRHRRRRRQLIAP